MSLHPQPVPPVPDETARVARAAFPHGNLYLLMRDEFGPLCTDEDFATLFPTRGQPAEAPWRLAVTDCNRNEPGLQSAHFPDHILCIYPRPQDRIICL